MGATLARRWQVRRHAIRSWAALSVLSRSCAGVVLALVCLVLQAASDANAADIHAPRINKVRHISNFRRSIYTPSIQAKRFVDE